MTSFSWNERFKGIKAIYILYAIVVIQVVNASFYILFLLKNKYLPAPFIMDKADTFMDFYNPLFWVIKGGFYSSFDSFYPALNYFFLRIFSLGLSPDLVNEPRLLRDSSLVISITLITFYCLIVFLVTNMGEWRRIKPVHGAIIFTGCMLSTPVLFALERANLIFLSLLFLGLYLNARSEFWRAIFLALLINIKPYYIVFLVPFININNFNLRFILMVLLIAFSIFMGLGWFADMDFIGYIHNFYNFSNGNSIPIVHVLVMPNSLDAIFLPLERVQFYVKIVQKFPILEDLSFPFLYLIIKSLNLLTLLLLIALTIFKRLSSLELLIGVFIVLTNLSISTGGYILMIYIILIPYLINSDEYRKLLLPVMIIFFIPFDWINIWPIHFESISSYLGNNHLWNIDFYIGLGSIVRPLANYSLMLWFIWLLYSKHGGLLSGGADSNGLRIGDLK